MATIRAVTFDYWNTIVRADADQGSYRVRAWRDEYLQIGHDVDEETIRTAFRTVWDEHHSSWLRNEQYLVLRAGDAAVDLVARPVDARHEGEARRAVPHGRGGGRLHPVRRRRPCSRGAAAAGRRPGDHLRRRLHALDGPAAHAGRLRSPGALRGWSFSDDVGWYKPAREIFGHALGYLGVPPDAVAHVGDLRRTDVAGARGMGMTAVRYRGANDDDGPGPEGDHVLDDHAALMEALAL